MIRIFIAIILTIATVAGVVVAIKPLLDATMDDRPHEHPAAVLFGRACYGLGVLALGILLMGFVWAKISGVSFDGGGTVGDIRCQRYESYFNGKTTSYEWRTIPCVQIGKGQG